MSVLVTGLILIVVLVVLPAIVMRMRGYHIGGRMVVRCHSGHLFTTIWAPGLSFKAARLGWWRFQRCPVGNHWTLVHPVKESDLTEEQTRAAHQITDAAVP